MSALGWRASKAYVCFGVSRFSSDQPHSDLPKKTTGSIKQGQREKVNILSFKAFYISLESKIFSVRAY